MESGFFPASNAQQQQEWMKNSDSQHCTICRSKFSLSTWRHHCRACGRLVCDKCSQMTPSGSNAQNKQRVCRMCFAQQQTSSIRTSPAARPEARQQQQRTSPPQARRGASLNSFVVASDLKASAASSPGTMELRASNQRCADLQARVGRLEKALQEERKERLAIEGHRNQLEKDLQAAKRVPPPVPPRPATRSSNTGPVQQQQQQAAVDAEWKLKVEQLRSELAREKAQRQSLEQEGKDIKAQLQTIEKTRSKLQGSNNQLARRVSSLESELSRCKQSKQKEINDLKAKLKQRENSTTEPATTTTTTVVTGWSSLLPNWKRSKDDSDEKVASEVNDSPSRVSKQQQQQQQQDDDDAECTFKPRLIANERKIQRRSSHQPTTTTTRNTSSSSLNNQQSTGGPGKSTMKKAVSATEQRSVNNRSPSRVGSNSSNNNSGRVNGRVGGGRGGQQKKKAAAGRRPFDLSTELSKIIGQTRLKQQLFEFEKSVALQKKRTELGIECEGQAPPHMMFLGNPGTGKTTIARLVGKILKNLGVLEKGHLVEVQRSDLVASAIGATALKTKEKIAEAQGGVLFVDEAYTLNPAGSAGETKDFGREAINEIMSCMNDGDPVVIFAGYEREMTNFVMANAGLFRRIDYHYHFANYSIPELRQILRFEVSAAGFTIDKSVSDKQLESVLSKHTTAGQRAAMNGGLARQIFRRARGRLDADLSLDASKEEMCTVRLSHLTAATQAIAKPPGT